MDIATCHSRLRLRLGAAETAVSTPADDVCLDVAADLLGGKQDDVLIELQDAEPFRGRWFRGMRGRNRMGGVAAARVNDHGSLEACAQNLYREMLELTRGHSLYRVWNFVPQINREKDGSENYHSFNTGRQQAFRERYGDSEMERHLPAASAVGMKDESTLAMAFFAGNRPVEYFENPRQTPAYRYPPKYGPSSPSFARGAVTSCGRGRVGYLSGTSSICGHETVGEGSLEAQFAETMENVRFALARMGFEETMASGDPDTARYRVYLRNPDDYERVREWFSNKAGEAGRRATFQKADICRRPLKLEIEGVFFADGPDGS